MPRKENRSIEMENDPFPKAIRFLLDVRKITQQVLADYLGVTRQTVNQYCLGKTSPDFNTLCKIADFFKISVDYLLGRTIFKNIDIYKAFQSNKEILLLICEERIRQDEKWGIQNYPLEKWVPILGEEFGEYCRAVNETIFDNSTEREKGGIKNIINELVHVAAVAVSAIECIHRNQG
jgi:transcriptional regulator with XRE-family HTH domain